MLFTDANWAEFSTSQIAIAKPYQPWRCVGWTDEEVCFWIFPEREANQAGDLPDGLLVVGPEVLLDAIAQLPPDGFSVYVLQPGSQGRPAGLGRLTGLYSQSAVAATALDYWYRTAEGDLHPCARRQKYVPNDAPLILAFASEVRDCCVV